jgi:hypothetical protein
MLAKTFPKVRKIDIDHFPNLTNIHINSEHFEDAAFYAKYRHIEFLYSIRDIDIIYEPNVNFEILALFHKLILFEPIAKKNYRN